ncbi:hypothetical protein, partial [Streptomyces virginiae]
MLDDGVDRQRAGSVSGDGQSGDGLFQQLGEQSCVCPLMRLSGGDNQQPGPGLPAPHRAKTLQCGGEQLVAALADVAGIQQQHHLADAGVAQHRARQFRGGQGGA